MTSIVPLPSPTLKAPSSTLPSSPSQSPSETAKSAPNSTSISEPLLSPRSSPSSRPPSSSNDSTDSEPAGRDYHSVWKDEEKRAQHIYEGALKYMDWGQNLPPPPPKQFKPHWFLQPTRSAHFSADWVGKAVQATYWEPSGPETETQAIWVGTREQEDELVDWAEEQGPGSMLFPEYVKVNGDDVVGYLLVMD